MRRFVVAAAASAFALALAACGSDDAGTGAPAPSAAGAADAAETASACAEAVRISKDGAAAFEPGVSKLLELAVEGDEAKLAAAEEEFRTTLTAWSDKLTEFAGEPVEADVRAALTEGAATVRKIADPADNTPVNAAKDALTGVADKITSACA
ncbi:hypothetical protein [Asanoa siamensis]|uniref:Secreted protein n=1 Tax=Asanoa siamensis TaxID=926357 RepID=A0ABQ4CH33_9ACTN|nr:hypothetical protein [Asanoa siamensis]GIF70594.1 hypothetical protein Asi02nite_01120 [Asanoa siamensis]